MRRISVIAVVRDAYAFAFAHLGAIIGLIWVPTLLLTVMGFFSSQHLYTGAIEALSGGQATSIGTGFLAWLAYLVSALLLQAVAFVAVVQLALGARTTPVIAHFAFGPLEWRMFSALASFTVLLLLGFLIGSTLVSAVAGRGLSPTTALLVLLIYGLMLAALARFFLLLPAIAVVETGPVLRRVWQVTMGNFGRLFLVLLAIIVPLFLLAMLLMIPVGGRIPPPPPGIGDIQAQQLAMMRWLRDALPYLWGLLFLISPLVVGLFAGASVAAWRALKDEGSVSIVA